MDLAPGLIGTADMVVEEADLATAFGSGDVAVVATPRLIALCEEATVAALDGVVSDPSTSVGTRVELDHMAAVGPGARVEAKATLVQVGGRSLRFAVEASTETGIIAAGTVRRVVVDRMRFLDNVR